MKIEVFKVAGPHQTIDTGKWYFRIKAGNGEIVAVSEGYHNQADALDTIDLLRTELKGAELVVVLPR